MPRDGGGDGVGDGAGDGEEEGVEEEAMYPDGWVSALRVWKAEKGQDGGQDHNHVEGDQNSCGRQVLVGGVIRFEQGNLLEVTVTAAELDVRLVECPGPSSCLLLRHFLSRVHPPLALAPEHLLGVMGKHLLARLFQHLPLSLCRDSPGHAPLTRTTTGHFASVYQLGVIDFLALRNNV